MYTLYEDVSVAEGEDRLDRVIDEAMLHLSKMSMPRREDGYPVEVTPNNFRFAERYFRQSIGWAEAAELPLCLMVFSSSIRDERKSISSSRL